MPREDYEIFLKIAPEKLRSKYIIDSKNTNPKYYLNFVKIRNKNTVFVESYQANYDGPKGIFLDIFPLDEAKSKENKLTAIQKSIVKIIRKMVFYKSGAVIKYRRVKTIIGNLIFFKNKRLLDLLDWIQKLQNNKNNKYIVDFGSDYNYKKMMFEKELFFPPVKMDFEGRKYNVPNQYDKVLTQIYGDYMKLPPEDKRVTHSPIEIKFEQE